MSLTGTLNTAASALRASQLSLQTVGNNIANAGNDNYARQITRQSSATPQQVRPGMFVGRGVNIDSIERQVDESVEQRLRASVADSEGNAASAQWMSQAEAVFNELSDEDLSSGMSKFFNSWSELANKPQDVGLRQVVIQDGQNLADQIKSLRGQFSTLRTDLQSRVKSYTTAADDLATQIADINKKIGTDEKGQGGSNGLRDQRDALLKDLSKLMNFKTMPGDNGMVNVFVGSEPLVTGAVSRGMTIRNETDATTGDITQTIIFKDNNGIVPVGSGILGSTKESMAVIDGSADGIDQIASSLIYELNKVHSSGQGLKGFDSVTSNSVIADNAAALNSDDADLDFKPTNGSFVVHVKDKVTGTVSSTLVQVDLDGTGPQTSLNSLVADLDGIQDISASVNAGRLTLKADSNAVEISFSQDSSGTLAALGVGGFFTGSDGRDIAINDALSKDPRLLAASKNGQPADNQTAKLIAALQKQPLGSLGDQSLSDAYQGQVNNVAAKVAGAKQDADAAQVVRDTLQSQRDSISGVSLDEEALSLMKYQRAYQAASRVIAATDEMMQTLMSLV